MVEQKTKRPGTHEVAVAVAEGKITVTPCCLHVDPGDRIVWRFDGHRPVAVIVEAFEGPLNRHYWTASVGETSIEATVRLDAKPEFYPYAVVVPDGTGLLVEDPEIIVRPPDGRG